MLRMLQYYGRYQSVREGLGGMPLWGRWLLMLAALPGLLAMALSILAVLVSLSALLILTVPVYRLVRAVSGFGQRPEPELDERIVGESPGRKPVDVRIIEES